jgi:hypothetical protein
MLTRVFRSTRNAGIAAQSSPLCFSTATFSALSSSFVHLTKCAAVSSFLESKILCHLRVHCFFVRPGTSAEMSSQFLPLCFSTASFSLQSSSFVHLPIHVQSFRRPQSRPRHRTIYSYTVFSLDPKRAEIAVQSLPLCFSTASFSVLSSSFVHLVACAVVSSLL